MVVSKKSKEGHQVLGGGARWPVQDLCNILLLHGYAVLAEGVPQVVDLGLNQLGLGGFEADSSLAGSHKYLLQGCQVGPGILVKAKFK